MDLNNVFVCSFYTADPYYRGHAATLRANLEHLEIAHSLQEIEKQPGEEWPDICRKKIPFLAGVCEQQPDKKVFWIDVDCQLLAFPEFVADFSADLIGFQRGFGTPLGIGYRDRTRFWEPCFFGINTTVNGRKFVADAKELEATSELRATDDYFFEESWRANAQQMSFQVIPSISVVSRAQEPIDGVSVFFSFGASGHVAEFKSQVTQHDHLAGSGIPRTALGQRIRRAALNGAKSIEHRLPDGPSQRLRKLADSSGITHLITGGGADALHSGSLVGGSPHRRRIVEQMIASAQRGEVDAMNEAWVRLTTSTIPTNAETLAKQVSDSYAHYGRSDDERPSIAVAWWPRPFPGNFGDWLSPLVISEVSGHSVRYVSPTAKSSDPHIVAVGSIGRFIKPRSIVVGTGISDTDLVLENSATYVSVRGPITAKVLAESGGPTVESFGDPGALVSRLLPIVGAEGDTGTTNGRLALVRHFTHVNVPLVLPDEVDELSVLMSHPRDIREFVERLHEYDGVVTSAMHVMIVCQSYGIPCGLIGFSGFETSVHGSGIKYEDYSRGAGLATTHQPVVVGPDLRRANLRDCLTDDRVSEAKLDEIEGAVRTAVDLFIEQQIDLRAVR